MLPLIRGDEIVIVFQHGNFADRWNAENHSVREGVRVGIAVRVPAVDQWANATEGLCFLEDYRCEQLGLRGILDAALAAPA